MSFDVCGPLPSGITVLEASAGTGKTYTIAALAARYVAEGTPLHQLLLVTFTRTATSELRDRVRERLVSTERALGGPSDDPVVQFLSAAPEAEVERRRARLLRALADFDAATIVTTHGFCQEVLSGIGVAGDMEPDAEVVEDVGELLHQVVDDLYVRRYMDSEAPPITREEALRIARAVINNPGSPVLPADRSADGLPALRARLAVAARDELDRRKRALGLITYDDLLLRLQRELTGPRGEEAIARLRSRYRVVLVDEFQDTDPIQWEILQRAFGGGGVTLVLIGDPKQAIYAFRGADVYSYLEAARAAGTRETLAVNRRSDQELLDAYDALFGGAALGHPEIVYRQVRAGGAHAFSRVGPPLRVRVVDRTDPAIERTRADFAGAPSTRAFVARDVAVDLVRLLGASTVQPGDVAVLVRTNRQAVDIRNALDAVGVPSVINGAGSVFATASAREWLRLLEALERPASSPRARAAAMTSFFGWSASQLAAASEAEREAIHERLHEWAAVLRQDGLAALFSTVTVSERMPGRVLSELDGERRLTDLRHIAQLLHAEAAGGRLGASALTVWLRARIAAAEREGEDEHLRRLESDAAAVQVLTIHRSKGLEFPIVYAPYLWDSAWLDGRADPVVFHDRAAGLRRSIDVGLEGSDYERHRGWRVSEERGEELRLAYVALTRARHQAVIWWAGSWSSRDSALSRLLWNRDPSGVVSAEGSRPPSDERALERFRELAAAAPGCIGVELTERHGLPASWSPPPAAAGELRVALFDRSLDRDWRRTSYSDITAASHESGARVVTSEPEEPVITDEPEDVSLRPASTDPGADAALAAVPVLLGEGPGGTAFGTFVHTVFEDVDFAAADLDVELGRAVGTALARRAVEIGDRAAVVAGLRAAIETPLGPLAGGRRLRDIPRADRLDELTFELPLVGGDEPTGVLTPAAIGAVLRAHLPAGDPLIGYADRLSDPELRGRVRGYLTGSIDLALRIGDAFAVVDYKTNWLAGPGEVLTAWHHRPAALLAEMERAHYGLQALLYTAALHRFLRWRLRGYDPERHLAGVLYLFVRGMVGPDTPTVDGVPCGVFSWRPPAPLVVALSDLLDRGAS